jgi:hypothetical protein
MSPRISKNIFQKLALSMIGIILGMVILEGGLWITGFSGSSHGFSHMEFDSELGWTTPKSFNSFRSFRHSAHFSYFDPDGFPATVEQWQSTLDRQSPSIAFVGDSFTEGFYIPYESTFVNLVDMKFPNQQAINLGVTGFAPDQYLIQSRRHIDDFNVTDIVVMFFAANDVPEALVEISNGFSKPVFDNPKDSPVNLPLVRRSGPSGPSNLFRKIQSKSAIFQIVRPVLNQYIMSPLGFGEKSIFNANKFVPEAFSKSDMMWSVSLINQISIEHPDADFFAYYIPRLEEFQAREIYDSNVNLFLDSCQKFGMECFTATKIFDLVDDPADVYLPFDGHFSELGSSLVADELSTILRAQ